MAWVRTHSESLTIMGGKWASRTEIGILKAGVQVLKLRYLVPSPLKSGEKVADRPDEGAFEEGRVPERPPHPNRLRSCGVIIRACNPANDSGERGPIAAIQLEMSNFKNSRLAPVSSTLPRWESLPKALSRSSKHRTKFYQESSDGLHSFKRTL